MNGMLASELNKAAKVGLAHDGLRVSTAQVARSIGEHRSSWHAYLAGETLPGLAKVQAWQRAWATKHSTRLVVVIDGETVRVVVTP